MKRAVALFALVTFVVTNHCVSPAFGAGVWTDAAKPAIRDAIPSEALRTLRIPDHLGTVEEHFEGTKGKTVLVIQDAHSIPDAQLAIHRLIDHFRRQYGVRLVAVEGASAKLDAVIFRAFPDKKLLKDVFKSYHEKGELAGAAAAAVFGDPGADYVGVEQWGLYEEGVSLYLAAMEKQPAILETLRAEQEALDRKKQEIYSAELLEVDRALEAFEEEHADILGTLKTLAKYRAPEAGSEIAALLRETGHPVSDLDQANIEVRELGAIVSKHLRALPPDALSKEKLRAFHEKEQAFMTSAITPHAFGLFLKEVAEAEGLKVETSEALASLMDGQQKLRDIKGTRFFERFNDYAASVKEKLFASDDERDLDAQTDELGLWRRFAMLELSSKDWERIKEELRIKNEELKMQDREKTNPLLRSSLLIINFKLFAAHMAFYMNAEARDGEFMKNLSREIGGRQAKSAVFVAGGFHAEAMTRRFREAGISYVLIMPKIGLLPENPAYRDHMRGLVSWRDYFEVENSRIDLYKAFVRATRDKLLGREGRMAKDEGRGASLVSRSSSSGLSDPRLLKDWRDGIIREMAGQGAIERSGEYTKFLDEVAGPQPKDPELEKRLARVDAFVEGLKRLESENAITPDNVLKLFQPATVQDPCAVVPFAPGNSVPGGWVVRPSGLAVPLEYAEPTAVSPQLPDQPGAVAPVSGPRAETRMTPYKYNVTAAIRRVNASQQKAASKDRSYIFSRFLTPVFGAVIALLLIDALTGGGIVNVVVALWKSLHLFEAPIFQPAAAAGIFGLFGIPVGSRAEIRSPFLDFIGRQSFWTLLTVGLVSTPTMFAVIQMSLASGAVVAFLSGLLGGGVFASAILYLMYLANLYRGNLSEFAGGLIRNASFLRPVVQMAEERFAERLHDDVAAHFTESYLIEPERMQDFIRGWTQASFLRGFFLSEQSPMISNISVDAQSPEGQPSTLRMNFRSGREILLKWTVDGERAKVETVIQPRGPISRAEMRNGAAKALALAGTAGILYVALMIAPDLRGVPLAPDLTVPAITEHINSIIGLLGNMFQGLFLWARENPGQAFGGVVVFGALRQIIRSSSRAESRMVPAEAEIQPEGLTRPVILGLVTLTTVVVFGAVWAGFAVLTGLFGASVAQAVMLPLLAIIVVGAGFMYARPQVFTGLKGFVQDLRTEQPDDTEAIARLTELQETATEILRSQETLAGKTASAREKRNARDNLDFLIRGLPVFIAEARLVSEFVDDASLSVDLEQLADSFGQFIGNADLRKEQIIILPKDLKEALAEISEKLRNSIEALTRLPGGEQDQVAAEPRDIPMWAVFMAVLGIHILVIGSALLYQYLRSPSGAQALADVSAVTALAGAMLASYSPFAIPLGFLAGIVYLIMGTRDRRAGITADGQEGPSPTAGRAENRMVENQGGGAPSIDILALRLLARFSPEELKTLAAVSKMNPEALAIIAASPIFRQTLEALAALNPLGKQEVEILGPGRLDLTSGGRAEIRMAMARRQFLKAAASFAIASFMGGCSRFFIQSERPDYPFHRYAGPLDLDAMARVPQLAGALSRDEIKRLGTEPFPDRHKDREGLGKVSSLDEAEFARKISAIAAILDEKNRNEFSREERFKAARLLWRIFEEDDKAMGTDGEYLGGRPLQALQAVVIALTKMSPEDLELKVVDYPVRLHALYDRVMNFLARKADRGRPRSIDDPKIEPRYHGMVGQAHLADVLAAAIVYTHPAFERLRYSILNGAHSMREAAEAKLRAYSGASRNPKVILNEGFMPWKTTDDADAIAAQALGEEPQRAGVVSDMSALDETDQAIAEYFKYQRKNKKLLLSNEPAVIEKYFNAAGIPIRDPGAVTERLRQLYNQALKEVSNNGLQRFSSLELLNKMESLLLTPRAELRKREGTPATARQPRRARGQKAAAPKRAERKKRTSVAPITGYPQITFWGEIEGPGVGVPAAVPWKNEKFPEPTPGREPSLPREGPNFTAAVTLEVAGEPVIVSSGTEMEELIREEEFVRTPEQAKIQVTALITSIKERFPALEQTKLDALQEALEKRLKTYIQEGDETSILKAGALLAAVRILFERYEVVLPAEAVTSPKMQLISQGRIEEAPLSDSSRWFENAGGWQISVDSEDALIAAPARPAEPEAPASEEPAEAMSSIEVFNENGEFMGMAPQEVIDAVLAEDSRAGQMFSQGGFITIIQDRGTWENKAQVFGSRGVVFIIQMNVSYAAYDVDGQARTQLTDAERSLVSDGLTAAFGQQEEIPPLGFVELRRGSVPPEERPDSLFVFDVVSEDEQPVFTGIGYKTKLEDVTPDGTVRPAVPPPSAAPSAATRSTQVDFKLGSIKEFSLLTGTDTVAVHMDTAGTPGGAIIDIQGLIRDDLNPQRDIDRGIQINNVVKLGDWKEDEEGRLAGIRIGEASLTDLGEFAQSNGFDQPIRSWERVIRVVSHEAPTEEGGQVIERANIEAATRAVVELAAKNGAKKIVMPLFGTGSREASARDVASWMRAAVEAYIQETGSPIEITIVTNDEEIFGQIKDMASSRAETRADIGEMIEQVNRILDSIPMPSPRMEDLSGVRNVFAPQNTRVGWLEMGAMLRAFEKHLANRAGDRTPLTNDELEIIRFVLEKLRLSENKGRLEALRQMTPVVAKKLENIDLDQLENQVNARLGLTTAAIPVANGALAGAYGNLFKTAYVMFETLYASNVAGEVLTALQGDLDPYALIEAMSALAIVLAADQIEQKTPDMVLDMLQGALTAVEERLSSFRAESRMVPAEFARAIASRSQIGGPVRGAEREGFALAQLNVARNAILEALKRVPGDFEAEVSLGNEPAAWITSSELSTRIQNNPTGTENERNQLRRLIDAANELLNLHAKQPAARPRAEQRQAEMPKVVVDLAGETAQVILTGSDPARVAGRIPEILRMQGLSAQVFGTMVRNQAAVAIQRLETVGVVSPYLVTPEVARAVVDFVIENFVARMNLISEEEGNFVIGLDTEVTNSFSEALAKVAPYIQLALVNRGMLKQMGRVRGMNVQGVPDFENIRKPAMADNETIPVVNGEASPDYLGTNPIVIGITTEAGEMTREDPYLLVVENVIKLLAAVSLARRVKNTKIKDDPRVQSAMEAELIKDLFETGVETVISFKNGVLSVNRPALYDFIKDFATRKAVEKAA